MGLIDTNGGARILPDRGPAGAKGCLLTLATFLVLAVMLTLGLVLLGALARSISDVIVLGWELAG